MIPYDHSRVHLDVEDQEDPVATDYINASWIGGYERPQEWIATQGSCRRVLEFIRRDLPFFLSHLGPITPSSILHLSLSPYFRSKQVHDQ